MKGIILCSLFLFVVICCSNGAPVGHRHKHSKTKIDATKTSSHAADKKHSESTIDPFELDDEELDSHVTESKPLHPSHHKRHQRCRCKPKHTVQKKPHHEGKTFKRDTCFPCCCHPQPSQAQSDKQCGNLNDAPSDTPGETAAPGTDDGGGGGVGGATPPQRCGPTGCHRFHAAGECGCGYCHCRPLGPSGHGAHASCYDSCCSCHQKAGGYPNGQGVGSQLEQDALPSMKCVHVGGNICLGLPHPCLQLNGEQPIEHRVPPCNQLVCVNGNIAMGLPHPEYQVDCNQTVGALLSDGKSSGSCCGGCCSNNCGGGNCGGGCGGHSCGGSCNGGSCGGSCNGGSNNGDSSYGGDHVGENFNYDRGVPSYNNGGHGGGHGGFQHEHEAWPGGHGNHGCSGCGYGGGNGGGHGGADGGYGGGGYGGGHGCGHHDCGDGHHGGHHCDCRDSGCHHHDDDDDDNNDHDHHDDDDSCERELHKHLMIKPGGPMKD